MLNRSYVNGRAIRYDHLEKVTWSPIMIENLVGEIGYEMADDDVVNHPRANLPPVISRVMRVYANAENAEVQGVQSETEHGQGVQSETEPGHGVEAETEPPIPIQIVYPHDVDVDVNQFEFVRRAPAQRAAPNHMEVEEPDVVQCSQQMAEQEAGNRAPRRSHRQNHRKNVMQEEEVSSDSNDDDYDPGTVVDSDNEIGVGDDDLYGDNVDEDEPEHKGERKSNEKVTDKGKEKVKPDNQDKGKQIYNSDEDLSKGEDLWAPDSGDEEMQLKFKSFRAGDLHRPMFHVGKVFESVELLRAAIKEYRCQNRVDTNYGR
ncbi:hypothetical protein D1007_11801 [Hordeum vulgare]|nr:hypothetical protein D1007_11801 [Hordeum vulgare]